MKHAIHNVINETKNMDLELKNILEHFEKFIKDAGDRL